MKLALTLLICLGLSLIGCGSEDKPTGAGGFAPVIIDPGPQRNLPFDFVSLQIEASDPDRGALTFDAVGLPSGLGIDPSSGLIHGLIAGEAIGTNSTVALSVFDGELSDTTSFSWVVDCDTSSITVRQGVWFIEATATYSGGDSCLARPVEIYQSVVDRVDLHTVSELNPLAGKCCRIQESGSEFSFSCNVAIDLGSCLEITRIAGSGTVEEGSIELQYSLERELRAKATGGISECELLYSVDECKAEYVVLEFRSGP